MITDRTRAHTRYYLANGDLAVGVTTVLSVLAHPQLIVWANKQGLAGFDTTKIKDQAADRGTIAHLMINCDIQNTVPDLSSYAQADIDVATLCLNSFKEWRKNHTLEPIHMEKALCSERFRYGGTPDYFGYVNGELQLLDFKSSNAIRNDYYYQLAAYRQLEIEQGYEFSKARILRFSKDDNAEFEDRLITHFKDEFELFLHCLSIYQLLKIMKRSL